MAYAFNRTIARTTVEATNVNASRALDAAHAAQLWDKRAEAYVDALSVISRNLIILEFFENPPLEKAPAESLQSMYEAVKEVDWALLHARIAAYAPEPVLDALNAALHTHLEFDEKFGAWRAAGGQVGSDPYNLAREAGQAARATAKKLERLIRIDLAQQPSERAL